MAEVKWIKITTDIFDDEKILLIESLPDPYATITVWFKLLCLAGKQNNSGVFMMGRIPYTDKMLATIFRMKESQVTMALQTFEQFGMIEIVDGVITIPNWDKHQTLDSYEKRKERDRLYQAERRANQRALIAKSTDASTDASTDSSTDPSSDVGFSDIDKDKDIDIDNNICRAETYKDIIDYLNSKAGTAYKASTKATQKHINARLKEGFTVDNFKAVIDKKVAEWKNDPKMSQYLRQETLFGTKFEAYLNTPCKAAHTAQAVNTDLDDIF